jgi:hypothetical protein
MGFLGYFFNMQCPECDYICFKQTKVCGGCGFNFKKAGTSAASLFRNTSFSVFARPEEAEKEQEVSAATASADIEEIAVMEPPEDSQENPEQESDDFLLNLSDAEAKTVATDLKPPNSDSETLEFGTDSDINLEEVEVEGLGLGLEPFEEELAIPVADETKPDENILEITGEPEAIELTPDEGSSDSPIELAIDDGEPTLEVMPTSMPEASTIETDDEVSLEGSEDIEIAEDVIELTLTPSPEQEDIESPAPVLDLGEDEVSLEIDGDFDTESHTEPPPLPVEIDELDLNLELDDSDGPLSTTNIETPDIEIEDLGLELEDTPPDPEKP